MAEKGIGLTKRVILILSGKGGVGKSSVATQLAASLALSGKQVGLLDVDLCGPSIPRMLNLVGSPIEQGSSGWLPIILPAAPNGGVLKVLSIAFLLPNQDDAVVWRGPKKTAMIKQFLTMVEWGPLDYLIVDTPPGTGDEHLALLEVLQPLQQGDNSGSPTRHLRQPSPAIPFLSAIMVSTPQRIALADVEREIGFCKTTDLPIISLIENMSGYQCPHCQECTRVFGSLGGQLLAEKHGIHFAGALPITPALAHLLEDEEAQFLRDYPVKLADLYYFFVKLIQSWHVEANPTA